MSETRRFFAPRGWLGVGHGPRYLQLQRRIAEAIDIGLFRAGDPLPAEREIANLTGTSRVTVRRAIEHLVQAGRIVQRQGSGSFVQAAQVAPMDPPGSCKALGRLASLGEELALRGIAATVSVLEAGIVVPHPEVVSGLGLSPKDRAARILRLRFGDGDVIGLEETFVPADILPKPKKAGRALYDALEAKGYRPMRAIQRVSAVRLGKKDARHLEQGKGAAALEIRRTGYLPTGRPVEVTRAIYLAGRFDTVSELVADPGARVA
ncbi:MAG: GntR family transcriptional regulator [Pseudomonadota bacterium]